MKTLLLLALIPMLAGCGAYMNKTHDAVTMCIKDGKNAKPVYNALGILDHIECVGV